MTSLKFRFEVKNSTQINFSADETSGLLNNWAPQSSGPYLLPWSGPQECIRPPKPVTMSFLFIVFIYVVASLAPIHCPYNRHQPLSCHTKTIKCHIFSEIKLHLPETKKVKETLLFHLDYFIFIPFPCNTIILNPEKCCKF